MIPTSLSASSVLVSEGCLARWKVEYFNKAPSMDSDPAMVGTTCHFAFEHFVKAVYLDKTHTWDDVAYLEALYKIGYVQTFGNADYDTAEFADGAALVAQWYDRNRQGLPNTVLTTEQKTTFPLKTSVGEIPFTYIFDRMDQVNDTEFEVVDYKSIRAFVTSQDLKKKVQPRAYALAAQIQYPHATRIWVSFDMLRHGGIVGCVFTRDENAATYRYLQRAAERIIATPEDDAPETLNPECNYCLRKSICETLEKANRHGSVLGLSLEQVAEKRVQVQSQIKALEYLDAELDELLMKEAEQQDSLEFEAGPWKIEMTASARRKATNPMAITRLVGPELTAKYGNWTVGNVDKMLESGVLTPEVAAEVRRYIPLQYGEPKSKVTPKDPFEESKNA
jgi:hypothetical protein